MRYWYHPESDCLWTGPDSTDECARGDVLVEELDEQEYLSMLFKTPTNDGRPRCM